MKSDKHNINLGFTHRADQGEAAEGELKFSMVKLEEECNKYTSVCQNYSFQTSRKKRDSGLASEEVMKEGERRQNLRRRDEENDLDPVRSTKTKSLT